MAMPADPCHELASVVHPSLDDVRKRIGFPFFIAVFGILIRYFRPKGKAFVQNQRSPGIGVEIHHSPSPVVHQTSSLRVLVER